MAATRASHFWSDEETEFCLKVMKELNITKCLDGRRHRNADLFKSVADKLCDAGFPPRTVEQVRSRWKILKKHYYLAKRQNQKSGSDPATFKFFETLDEMLGHRPLATAASSGVDIGFSNAAEPPQGDDLYPDMDDDAEEDLSRASTPAPAEATEDSAASANIDSLPASAEGIPTYASCERPSQESTTQDRRRRRRLNNTLSRQQDFLERFQEAQNTWMEHQLRESFERERQLLTEVMQQSSRSMESLLRPLLGGMRGPYIPPSFQPTFPYANPNNMHYEVSPSYYPAPDTSQQGRGGAMEDNSENSFFEL
ncbi:uncharacterized protein LOC117262024 [Epinephelus lanceolatus]